MVANSRARLLNTDLCVLGVLFFLARVPWIIAQRYHGDRRTIPYLALAAVASLVLILVAHVCVRPVPARARDFLARTAVLAMFIYLVALQLRQFLNPGAVLGAQIQAFMGIAGLGLAALGARWLAGVWARLPVALLTATLIALISPFLLVGALARGNTWFTDTSARHRPVVALILDEFSAGSARPLITELSARGFNVKSWAFRSVGVNTIDAIPAIITGTQLVDARACTPTAVCGRYRAVDFSRMNAGRADVDVVAIYHPYCSVKGLRHCVYQDHGLERPLVSTFTCALPIRFLIDAYLECPRAGYASPGAQSGADMEAQLFDAPFWSQGGMLFGHLIIPHPPSYGGEVRLADAYAANISRAEQIVIDVLDRLERGPHRKDYSLVITSDHPLRRTYWCATEPYSRHDCELPESMLGPNIPFIVVNRGSEVTYLEPRSNADLFRIASDLSR